MITFVFTLSALLASAHSPLPKVGDHAAYSGTLTRNGVTGKITKSLTVIRLDPENNSAIVRIENYFEGTSEQKEVTQKVEREWEYADLLRYETDDELREDCEKSGNTYGEELPVPAGNFSACRVDRETDHGSVVELIANIPFKRIFVESESTTEKYVLELSELTYGK